MLFILYDPLGHYLITILPLPYLYIITGIISSDIPNPPPLDREATSLPCEELNKASPKAARGSARPRIISFPLDDLANFFREHTQGSKENLPLKHRHIKGRRAFDKPSENNSRGHRYSQRNNKTPKTPFSRKSRGQPAIIAKRKATSPGDIAKVPGNPKPSKEGKSKKARRSLSGRPPRYNQLRPNLGNHPSLLEPP